MTFMKETKRAGNESNKREKGKREKEWDAMGLSSVGEDVMRKEWKRDCRSIGGHSGRGRNGEVERIEDQSLGEKKGEEERGER